MWLDATIRKNSDVKVTAKELAAEMGLDIGVIGYRPVIIRNSEGIYTRLFDPNRIGVCIEYHDEETKCQLALNFPCGDRDIELYFMILDKIVTRTGSFFFEIDEEMISAEAIDECVDFYKRETRRLLKLVKEDFDKGRDGYLVYGSKMPVVLGPNEFTIIGDDIHRFVEMYCERQQVDAKYVTPTLFSYREKDYEYGAYELVGHHAYILPYDPEFLFNYEKKKSRFGWFVDIGFANIRYDDFMAEVSKKNTFDEENIIVTLTPEQKDDLCRRLAYDPDQEKLTCQPRWGRWFLNGRDHAAKVSDKELGIEEIKGYDHLAIMLRWLVEHNRLSEDFKRWYPKLVKEMEANIKDLRYIICNSPVFDGRLRVAMFDYEATGILNAYCTSDCEYQVTVDLYAEEYFGSERYNSEEFKDEAYLFVPFDEEYYEYMAKHITERFEHNA